MFYHAAIRIHDVGPGCIGQGVGIAAGPLVGCPPGHLARCRMYTNWGWVMPVLSPPVVVCQEDRLNLEAALLAINRQLATDLPGS